MQEKKRKIFIAGGIYPMFQSVEAHRKKLDITTTSAYTFEIDV